MARQKLAYYLEDLTRLREISIEELNAWIAAYPYASNLRFLLAKKCQMENKTEDLSPFHQAATYAPDRTVLFKRLTQSEVERPAVEEIIEPIIEAQPKPKKVKKKKKGTIKTKKPKKLALPQTEEIEEIVPIAEESEAELTLVDTFSNEDSSHIENESTMSEFSNWLLSLDDKSKKKKKDKNPQKQRLKEISKRSISRNEEVVSEPLAKLLAEQGHNKRAKKMYQLLSLKYPEKNSYFAGLIENIQKKDK